MTVPSYTTDLNDISTCEAIGTWVEMVGHTGGGAATLEGTYYIQGSKCISQSTGTKTGTACGLEFDYTSDMSGSMSAGDCFFVWQIYLASLAIDTWDNGGMRFAVGSSAGNLKFWKTVGKDYGRNPYGGWQNIAIDPTFAADYTDGSPTGAYQIFGSLPNLSVAVNKGNPHGVDVIRYGRGEVKIEYGEVSDYGTFTGLATQNDSSSNRWGLFQEQPGSYLWKGLLSFGNSTNACDFRDSNVSITIDDTPRTYAAFNKIEINNASSRVDWTGINFIPVNASQLSTGQLEVVGDADVNFDLCTFTDMDTFIFKSNSTVTNTTFRRCGQVTQGDGVFTNCAFEGSASLYADDLENIDYCDFTSSGTGHAMELTISGTYTFTGNTFTSYGVSGTLDAALYNNSGGYILINVDGGGDSPTYRNGSGASTDVQAAVTLTLTNLITNSEVRIYSAGTTTELDGIENCGTTFPYTYNYAADTYVDIVVHHLGYEYYRVENYLLASTAASLPIAQRKDRWYKNP